MLSRYKSLILFGLAVFSLIITGCDQPEDVLTPVSQTQITLTEERLPNPPVGMAYELWAVNSTDSMSMGTFSYDFETRAYLNADLSAREGNNIFVLEDDLAKYTDIFVSVENVPDTDPDSPGPIMLIGDLSQKTVDMKFPMVDDSLWYSTIRYNMETPSDGLGNNNGHGIWFSSYRRVTQEFNDTTAITSWTIDSGDYVTEPTPRDNVIGIDSSSILVKDTTVTRGLDEFTRQVIRYDPIISHDTVNYYPTTLRMEFEVTEGEITFDDFTQDDFNLPDLTSYGWSYRGWVVSRHIDTTAVGTFTYPAWPIMGSELDNTDGGLLTTGSFRVSTELDNDNSYIDTGFRNPPRIPEYPGEDFLTNLPAPLTDVNLVDNSGNNGKVFVTLEPDNYTDQSTNFPLLLFIGDLPTNVDTINAEINHFTLRGWMQSSDPYRGFPKIRISSEAL